MPDNRNDNPAANDAHAAPDVPGHNLTRWLGRGPLANVWLGTQRSMERWVVVKVLDVADEGTRAHFEASLRAVSRLSHPSIAPIHMVGRTVDGRVFYTQPCLPDDISTQASLQHKPLAVAALLRTTLVALGYAHRNGVAHGGIKPANLRFDAQGRLLLCDFGLALAAHASGMPLPSAAAPWMSPDQVRGDTPDRDDDLYALAIVAWDLLTGATPFQGSDALSIAMAHVQQPVPRLPAMLRAWQPWMDKALAKTPAARFHSAREMALALADIDGQRNAELPERSAPTNDWRRVAIGVGAVIVVAVLAASAWALFGSSPAPQAVEQPVISAPAQIATAETAAPSPAATPVVAATAGLAQRVQALVAHGDALRARGRLFATSGDDAITAYLTAQNLDPGDAAATIGIGALLARQQQIVDKAWRDSNLAQLPDLVSHADFAAKHAAPAARRTWRSARDQLASAVGDAVLAAGKARDTTRLAALQALARLLPATYPAGYDMAAAKRLAAELRAGDALRDPSGPPLVYVPASANTPAYAIARTEVTRSQYAAFVHATHRPAASCVVAYNIFSRLRHLDWQAPGFAQGPDQPVVCVSHADAAAYVAWLSRTTGQPYHLPSAAQWARAAAGMPAESPCQLGNVSDTSRGEGFANDRVSCNDGAAFTAPVGHYAASGVGAYDMYGNVAEWLAGAGGSRAPFRGLSWRSNGKQAALAPPSDTSADQGYDNIGFRVLREIDNAHPAPPRSASH